jgi:magnesium chelatase accessory protein
MPRHEATGTLAGTNRVELARHGEGGSRAPRWDTDGRDWPNRDSSRFVEADGLRWHVQRMGSGPLMLLLHGTGASTHSWRDLAPELARHYTVIAPDLPGHGFTSAASERQYSLPGMARSVAALLAELRVSPVLIVGHSAGAAIALRMVLDGCPGPEAVVSLNGALLPFRGLPGQLFSPAARVLARLDFVPRVVARRAADPNAVLRLLRDTGSKIDERGAELYRRLIRSPAHVAATIRMMAGWDLGSMIARYPDVDVPVLLLVGESDGTVSPGEAERVARLLPAARVRRLPGLGHLAHEERPREVAGVIVEFAESVGVGG